MDFTGNQLAQQALETMRETNQSLFLTWKAGTGKSTLLKNFFNDSNRKVVVKLAPTGVAALNIGWMTIHKFFGFGIDTTLEKIQEWEFYMKGVYRKILADCHTIVIDEISMVRADLFEMLDEMCKVILWSDEPFGWKQLVLIGDLFQLPPVVKEQEMEIFTTRFASPYFFDSPSFADLRVTVIELTKIYRQTDAEFVKVLNKIRLGAHDEDTIEYLNSAMISSFEELPRQAIVVSTTRRIANYLNQKLLSELDEETVHTDAIVKWKFPATMHPNDAVLTFKVWAQIMMIKNHKDWLYHNGSIGMIKSLGEDENGDETVEVEIDGEYIDVTKEQWEVFEPILNKSNQTIEYESKGTFVQYPFRLWRAVTIHKSQWLTFDHVCIDIWWGAFAQWQTYVALSRARSYDGIYLNTRLQMHDIICDSRVVQFMGKATIPQKIDVLLDIVNETVVCSFVYMTPDWIEHLQDVTPIRIDQQEHNEKRFRVFTGTVDTEERKRSVRRMFEIEEITGE